MKENILSLLVALVIGLLFFPMCLNGQDKGTFIDSRDGKVYNFVEIGEQTWMSNNLAYKADSGCFEFRYKRRNAKKYGYLYTLEAAQNACPSGWHLPSKDEFGLLANSIDSISSGRRYEAIKEGRDQGVSFQFGGYYHSTHDYFRGGIPFRAVFYWASDDPLTNQYGVTIMHSFCINSFLKTAGLSFEFDENNGYSARCLKDKIKSESSND